MVKVTMNLIVECVVRLRIKRGLPASILATLTFRVKDAKAD
jgi:hypothetical protein